MKGDRVEMKKLNEGATIEQVKDFLMYHMDSADGRVSKINPAITKEDVWNINMGACLGGNITRVSNIVIRNITREFGKHYEG